MFFLVTTAIPVTSPAHRLPSGCKIQPPLLPLVYKAPWDSSSPSLPISSCVTVSTIDLFSILQRPQALSSLQAFAPAVPFAWMFLKNIKMMWQLHMYWWALLSLQVSALLPFPQKGSAMIKSPDHSATVLLPSCSSRKAPWVYSSSSLLNPDYLAQCLTYCR